jgi:Ni,Fe-hydrogenase III large subunit/Ni,Fe-hydrogenase III component G
MKHYIESLLHSDDYQFLGLFVSDKTKEQGVFILRYLFYDIKNKKLNAVEIKTEKEFPHINVPALDWYEREAYDMFGLIPTPISKLRPLMLFPENYPKDFHPLRKNANLNINYKGYQEYEYENFEPEGSFKILVGPIHAGIIEPGHFRFTLNGEPILKLEIRHFYKHKGIEKLAEGKPIEFGLRLSERISGDHSIAHSLAFVKAAETIYDIDIPPKAAYIRAILLELERLMCNINDFAFIFQDVGYSFGAEKVFAIKEMLMRLNEALTGNRFNRGIIKVGGISKEIDLNVVKDGIRLLKKEYLKYKKLFLNSSTILERTDTTGKVSYETAKKYAALGYIAKASGLYFDTRKMMENKLYGPLIKEFRLKNGDVTARLKVRFNDIEESFNIIEEFASNTPQGDIYKDYGKKEGYSFGFEEGQRGNITHMLEIENGLISRWKIRDPSFHNWPIIQEAVLGDIIADFPLINKSLNLSYAGNDL